MSHLFGDLVSQHLHRKHSLSQSKLAAGILQPPAVVSAMCKGQRLTGPQARERVVAIIGWLHKQGALVTLNEANAMLTAAGMAALNGNSSVEAALTQALRSRPKQPAFEPRLTPLPVTSEFPLVGRRAELEQLRAAWNQASRGQAHFVCITGDAGIGKTRLAEELLAEVHGQGHIAARTRAYALEGRLAYAPLADWLRSPALADGVSALDAVWRSELARLLPELLSEDTNLAPPQPLTERWQRKNLYEALVRAFSSSRGRPLLLVLDDLQWCDFETLEWLQYLLGAAPHLIFLIVGTVRDAELEADHPLHKLWRDLARDGQLTLMPLAPLSETETARLGAAVARHELDSNVAAQLFHESAGNPLFAIESVRSRPELQNGIAAVPSKQPTVALPPRVYAVIQHRLAQLTPKAHAVAELGAVIGRAFTLKLLAQASGRDEATAAQGADELLQRRLLREQDNIHYDFDFGHDRIRDVAYAEIAPNRRRVLHGHVAQALETIHADHLDAVAGELGEHYRQAGSLEKALACFRQAAGVARRLYAHSEVTRYLEKAIEVTRMAPDNPAFRAAEIDLWQELGFARIVIHDWASKPVGDAWLNSHLLATKYGSLFQQGEALHSLATVNRNRGQWRAAHDYDKLALPITQIAGDPALLAKTTYNHATSLYHFGEFERARLLFHECLEHFDTSRSSTIWLVGDLPRQPQIRLAKCLWMLGFPDQARAKMSELLVIAHAHSQSWGRFSAFDFFAMLYTYLRDIAGVRQMSEELMQISTKHEYPFYIRAANMYRGWVQAQCGDASSGVRLVRESVDVHRERGIRMFEPYWRALLAETLMLSGELREADDEVSAALAFADETGNKYWSAHLLKLKGDCALALSGSAEEAEAWYRRSLELAKGQGARSLELRAAMALVRLWQGRNEHKRTEAHAVLTEVYGWFTEGFDTADLQEARALLA